jgi:hypothetical protein
MDGKPVVQDEGRLVINLDAYDKGELDKKMVSSGSLRRVSRTPMSAEWVTTRPGTWVFRLTGSVDGSFSVSAETTLQITDEGGRRATTPGGETDKRTGAAER